MKSAQVSSPGARARGRTVPAAPKLTKLFNTKIITPRPPSTDALRDPRTLERERMVAALLAATDRISVSRLVDALLAAGHELPHTQEAHLQVLEHHDETRVRASLSALDEILSRDPAKRRPVLEQRLKRIEELADEPATRDLGASLRRKL